MKVYELIEIAGKLHLRQRNPLKNDGVIISCEMYAEHETLYIKDALLCEDLVEGKHSYTESELDRIAQVNKATDGTDYCTWQDCDDAETMYIDASPKNFRYIFRVRKLSSILANNTFQERVKPWLEKCFEPEIISNKSERALRFLEEALELVQALGCSKEEALRLVVWTFNRAESEPYQEVGGVMITLAALCLANGLDMHENGEIELARIEQPDMIEKIKAKQELKKQNGIAI